MGKAARRRHAEEQQKQYFDIHGDARSSEDKAKAREMLDALQKKLTDDALREDGFYFVDGQYTDARRPRFTPGMKTQSYVGHTRRITDSAVVTLSNDLPLPDGTSPAAVVVTISLWDLKHGELLSSLDISELFPQSICGDARLLRADTEAQALAIAYATHQRPYVHFFDMSTRTLTPEASTQDTAAVCCVDVGHQQQIAALALSHSGKVLATGSFDSSCLLWQVGDVNQEHPALTMLCCLPVAANGVSTCVFSHDDQVLTTGGDDCVLKLWDLADIEADTSLHDRRTRWEEAIPFALSISETLERFVFDDRLPMLHLNSDWQYESHRQCLERTKTLKIPQKSANDEEDGRKDHPEVATIDAIRANQAQVDQENVTETKSSTSEPVSEIERLRREYEKMEHFDFEKLLNPATPVVNSEDGTIIQAIQWQGSSDNAKRRLLRVFERKHANGYFTAHTSRLTDCAVAKDANLVVTVSLDKKIIVWSFNEGHALQITRDAHDTPILCCAMTEPVTMSSDLELLVATGGKDNCVKVWNAVGTKQPALNCVYKLMGHFDAITSLSFDATGIFLVSTGDDTLAHCWRVRPAHPEPPNKPIVTKIDRFTITIQWREPLANGSAIGEYVIQTTQLTSFYGEEDLKLIPDLHVAVKYKTFNVSGLQPGIQYQLRVSAVNGVGHSPWSEATDAVETLAFTPSKIPRAVQTSNVGTTSLRLTWASPAANGAPITHYIVRCLPENALFVPLHEPRVSVETLEVLPPPEDPKKTRRHRREVKTKPKNHPQQVTNGLHKTDTLYAYKVDGLWPGEVYQFVVAAENRCGVGEFSRFSDYIKMESTAPDAPEKPVIIRVEKRRVEVVWIKPRCNGSEILQYTVQWTQVDDLEQRSTVELLTKSIMGTHYSIESLRPGRPLRVWVAASNLTNGKLSISPFSEPSDEIRTESDVPDTPEPPKLVEATAHSLVVELTLPCDNGEPIHTLRLVLFCEEVQFGVVTKRLVREWELAPSDCETSSDTGVLLHTIYELRAKMLYCVSFCAVNSIGQSVMSDPCIPASTKPPCVPATIEAAPTVTHIEPTRAHIAWGHPKHDGGASIVSFILQYSIDDGPFKHEIQLFHGHELMLEHLRPKATYVFHVTAVNSVGRGALSPPCSAFTTPSLVEFTIVTYFASRPLEEHAKARLIQRRYLLWQRQRRENELFIQQLTLVLKHWHLL
ncbi:hypothetical protein Poli38472_003742 [Pythium oligandrum]|uniref:Fibronectin type-III domain-containing protein n=1 Tax=Pythium oligandrum TaxID=41045 RepID=A0A8K1CLZ9_PYTOL|nr:hypothetical protein Poli38472_003742 [Pythium oligandrum]|eukprot:TMW65977.1 hypothetical protein Poli38472_003742 [Pythium oligandrum]